MKTGAKAPWWSWLCVVALIGACGCSGIRALPTAGVPTLTVADLGPGAASGPLGRVAQGQAAMIHFATGDAVPVELETSLPFARLEPGHDVIRFQRDVYLYIARDTFAISPDQRRWANVGDVRAIKDLFGGGPGTLQIGFGAATGQPAAFHVGVGWR